MINRLGAELGAGTGQLGKRWCVAGFDCFAGHAHDRGRGSIALGASVIAAAAWDAVGLDGDVAKLSGHAVHAVEDFSIQNNGTADAGAEGDHHHVVDAAAGAQPLFAESSDFGIVVKEDASAQAALDFIAHRIVGPAGKIGRLAHHSGFHVNDAGDANARADKFSGRTIFVGEAVDRVAHFADDVVAAESDFHTQRDFLQHLSVGGDGCDAQVGSAEIDSDGKIWHVQKRVSELRRRGPHC